METKNLYEINPADDLRIATTPDGKSIRFFDRKTDRKVKLMFGGSKNVELQHYFLNQLKGFHLNSNDKYKTADKGFVTVCLEEGHPLLAKLEALDTLAYEYACAQEGKQLVRDGDKKDYSSILFHPTNPTTNQKTSYKTVTFKTTRDPERNDYIAKARLLSDVRNGDTETVHSIELLQPKQRVVVVADAILYNVRGSYNVSLFMTDVMLDNPPADAREPVFELPEHLGAQYGGVQA